MNILGSPLFLLAQAVMSDTQRFVGNRCINLRHILYTHSTLDVKSPGVHSQHLETSREHITSCHIGIRST